MLSLSMQIVKFYQYACSFGTMRSGLTNNEKYKTFVSKRITIGTHDANELMPWSRAAPYTQYL